MSEKLIGNRALERVDDAEGWATWVDRSCDSAEAEATGLLGRPGLWRQERRLGAIRPVFSCPPAPSNAISSRSTDEHAQTREAAVCAWACATAQRELPDAWVAPERPEAESWIDLDRLNVRVGAHVARGGLESDAERLRLRFPDLVRFDSRLSESRRNWARVICLDAQSRWQGVRFGVVGEQVGAEVDLSGAPYEWAESLVRWALESLVFSVGWALPALAAVVDPELSSPLFDLDPEGLGVARFSNERLRSSATGLAPDA